jgi:hypothetical protein
MAIVIITGVLTFPMSNSQIRDNIVFKNAIFSNNSTTLNNSNVLFNRIHFCNFFQTGKSCLQIKFDLKLKISQMFLFRILIQPELFGEDACFGNVKEEKDV